MAPDHGFADYLLFSDGQAVGTLEAKPEGYPLSSVEPQVKLYSEGLPKGLPAPHRPLPFLYLSTGIETRFANLLDPEHRTRPVFAVHRPETLAEWLRAETLEQWLAARAGPSPRASCRRSEEISGAVARKRRRGFSAASPGRVGAGQSRPLHGRTVPLQPAGDRSWLLSSRGR